MLNHLISHCTHSLALGRRSLRGGLLGALALGALACGSDDGADRDAVNAESGAGNGGGNDWVASGPPEGSPVALNGALRVEGTSLVNEQGQPVQLKGVSSMWLNWENTGYAESLTGLQWMRDNWNLSLIRAAMGVDESGAYFSNPTRALRQVRTIVRNAIDAGVYVIIDWHDHKAEEHEQESVEFFRMMAEEFGQYPNVFYETYNEPENVGNAGPKSWENMLKPYHEAVVAAIREVDPDNVAILGTAQWSQRVDLAVASPLVGDNLMYTVHFYSCSHQNQEMGYANRAFNEGLPLFVTEWGATHADGGTGSNTDVCEAEAQDWHDFMDARMISWAAWKLDDCGDISCMFRSGAPRNGQWEANHLNGHAPFVISRMQE